jgi:hypothetical protein
MFLIAPTMLVLAERSRADEPRVQAVRTPDGGICPQVQSDSRGRIHLIYFKGEPRSGDVFYVRSDDGGSTFTKPIRVNSQPQSVIIMGTVRGPHLALGKNDRPHVAWMGSEKAEPKVDGKAVPMLYTRLNDAGDAFEPQRNVVKEHPGLDGGGSVAADRDGNVYVAWHAPEHAEPAPAGGGHEGHGQAHDAAQGHSPPQGHGQGHGEEDRQVWVARSRDDGKTFDTETAAIPQKTGVCACCGMNITAADGGRVVIVFRSAKQMVNRDIYLLVSKDFGKSFEVASVDPWTIGKCVMSTSGFAWRGQDVLAAWETKEQIRLAVLDGKASPVQPLSMPGSGPNRKHPAVGVNSRGEILMAWTEGTTWGSGGVIAWQVLGANGEPLAGRAGRAEELKPWSVPAISASNDGSFTVFY